mgnify:CR=1 FL=1
MKRVVIFSFLIGFSSLTMAQKASAEKQDQIIKAQEETKQALSELMKNQADLISLYGGQLDKSKEMDVVSYAYGVSIGENLKAQGINDMNFSALSKGLIESMLGRQTMISPEDAQNVLNEYMTKLSEARMKEMKAQSAAYLAENGKKEGVTTTESGLQYEVLKKGDGGDHPTASSKVTVHYHGTKIDGSVFDSSVDRGEPATFGLNQVIKGWTEGVQLLTVGSKYRFYVPSDLAYGDRGAGGKIGPGETLIFEIELISFQ